MGSAYFRILKEKTLGSANTARIVDFDETDPFYFVVYDGDKLLCEGELPFVKLKLPEQYMYKQIKRFQRNRTNMTATIVY